MYPVILTGGMVGLREFRADDADAALAIVGDDDVTSWLSFDSRDRAQTIAMLTSTIDRARQEPRSEYYLAVTLPEPDGLIGFARLGLDGDQAAKLGYAIRRDQWGHGYATDAVRTLIEFGFRELKLHRISAAVGPNNAASIAMVTKLSLQYEGRIRDHVHTNGAWRDSLLYSVLAHDWTVTATASKPIAG